MSAGRRLTILLVSALVVIASVDTVIGRLAPPRNLREVEDAVRDLERGDPTVLAIGSSHGRTFHTLGESLTVRTRGAERVVAVPVEWGKLSSYRWVLEHRLLPLLDPARPSLRRAIIATEWWDSCADPNPPRNLPARSWTWRDFGRDLRAHGLTSYNRNFLAYRFQRRFGHSALVQDRGHRRILPAVRRAVAPVSEDASRANFEAIADEWKTMVEEGDRCLADENEMAAFAAMLDTLAARRVETTIVLYPRMPVTLTARAKATTLPRFAERVRALAEPRGVRVVDLTDSTPLRDEDFGDDFDHVRPEANRWFAQWALDGPLNFLLTPVSP